MVSLNEDSFTHTRGITMTTYINGNARLFVDHSNSTYTLQHPEGSYKNWVNSITANTPEEFLKRYLDRNLNRIEHQPKKMAENVKTVLSALCSA